MVEEYPFIIRYADGTYSYNCYHIPARLDAGEYSRDRLESWDWNGIPLNKGRCTRWPTVQRSSTKL